MSNEIKKSDSNESLFFVFFAQGSNLKAHRYTSLTIANTIGLRFISA